MVPEARFRTSGGRRSSKRPSGRVDPADVYLGLFSHQINLASLQRLLNSAFGLLCVRALEKRISG